MKESSQLIIVSDSIVFLAHFGITISLFSVSEYMSDYSVGYIIDTNTLRLYGRLSLMLLNQRNFSFSICSHDERYSCLYFDMVS